MHYIFFLSGVCTALDESTTSVAPSAQGPSSDGGYCQHGIPCAGWGCHGCKVCDHGYQLVHPHGYGKCVPVCNCTNGTGAVGSSQGCNKSGDDVCFSCDTGYKFKDFKCNICARGYGLVLGACVPVCKCPNGTPLGPANLECELYPGNEVCTACNKSFYLDPATKTCKYRNCPCNNGIGVRGPACEANSQGILQEQCDTCDPNYVRDADSLLCKLPNNEACTDNSECFSGSCVTGDHGEQTCQCAANCAYTEGTVVNYGNVDNESDCLKLCSKPHNPLGNAAVYTFFKSVGAGETNCQCRSTANRP